MVCGCKTMMSLTLCRFLDHPVQQIIGRFLNNSSNLFIEEFDPLSIQI